MFEEIIEAEASNHREFRGSGYGNGIGTNNLNNGSGEFYDKKGTGRFGSNADRGKRYSRFDV